ncbi:MAG: hypothetical protein IJ172_11275 [Ruminococcus sp.]|nr:hypothetical protein [Ruminococcus sp.]
MKKLIAGVLAVSLTFLMCSCDLSNMEEDEDEQITTTSIEVTQDPVGQTTTTSAVAQTTTTTTTAEAAKAEYKITDQSFHYYQNSIGNYEYYGIIEITNTGSSNLYLGDCKFNLEDNNGHLLQVDDFVSTCPDIIAPGEKGYYYNGLGSTSISEGVSLANGVKLVPEFEVKVARDAIVDYPVSDTSMTKDEYGGMKIVGRVENTTSEDSSLLYIEALYLDANGKVLAISGVNVTELKANSKTGFEIDSMFMDDTVKPEQIKSFKIIARKMSIQL